ncbi:hypothetical protein SLA2020_113040 [Shorea laevis]
MGWLHFVGFIIMSLLASSIPTQAQLQLGFYSKSCPKAEKIMQDFVNKHIHNAPSLAATLIRMHFHDCFVRGCDASLLLNSTGDGDDVERCPFQIYRLEDIIALVARDAIVATGGPSWRVPTGRRDGLISRESEASTQIPAPFDNLTVLQTRFASKGLDIKDLVLLSGAHTIGVAQCSVFANRRLFNFSGVAGAVDPSMDSLYAANLKANKCRSPNDNTTIVEMDPGSRNTFDLSYYSLLLKGRGLFESDQALTSNATSLAIINQLLRGSVGNFFREFGLSMERMGRIQVKTGENGTEGEVRKHCALVNG